MISAHMPMPNVDISEWVQHLEAEVWCGASAAKDLSGYILSSGCLIIDCLIILQIDVNQIA